MVSPVRDPLRENIIKVMSVILIRRVRLAIRRNEEQFVSPHPTRNPRNDLQTLELPFEDYEAIAERVTQLLRLEGSLVTVKYDASNGVRAFTAQLR